MRIQIVDNTEIPDGQVRAMAQAMYSRSPLPIADRLVSLKEGTEGSVEERMKANMATYYLGYGHESIGELADTTLFVEDISMLAAKALQQNGLYRGQECSTRYIDFSNVPFLTATTKPKAHELNEKWRALYLEALPKIVSYLRGSQDPSYILPESVLKSGDNYKVSNLFEKTIKAQAFDIARGFLPCGASTSVAWTGDYRTIRNHLKWMFFHPLQEVRDIAVSAWSSLEARYSATFEKLDVAIESVSLDEKRLNNYYLPQSSYGKQCDVILHYVRRHQNSLETRQFLSAITPNRRHTPPRGLEILGTAIVSGKLDFGSYRDLQRHRKGYMGMPIVDGFEGLHSWYLDQWMAVDTNLHSAACELFEETDDFVNCQLTDIEAQYHYPMATSVPVEAHWDFQQLAYVVNLRTGVTVHPTLRHFMKTIAKKVALADQTLAGAIFDVDERGDYQATWRGAQDIVKKE